MAAVIDNIINFRLPAFIPFAPFVVWLNKLNIWMSQSDYQMQISK
ncbi:MAG TPA: hypothetical protein PKG49_06420 [Nitrosomonas mobilis]|nr:hypothetical protein [Nitrosomonas mobilis]